MQNSTDGLITFLPHGLPFICQPAGMSGTVVIQSSHLNNGASTVPLDETLSSQADVPQVASTTAVTEIEVSEEQLKIDMQSIYKHPLFPLLTQLFERCEKATRCGPGSSSLSESFDEDILSFVRQQEQNGLPFFIDNPDVDGLMVRAIQVFRIHVLEIEKVGELCKDFCQRYIASLKLKLNSEQLLGDITEIGNVSDDDRSASCASKLQHHPITGLAQGQVVSGGTVYQMVHTPQGLVAQPIQIQQPVIHPVSSAALLSNGSSACPLSHFVTPSGNTGVHSSSYEEDETNQKKLKRGVLPRKATQIMKSWLFQHLAHPYPTEDEKRQIAAQTNLSLLQVNNWFINGRRRILQPMLDAAGASNTSDSKPRTSKSASSTKSAQRFWPETIANIHVVLPSLNPVEDSRSEPSDLTLSERVSASDEESENADSCSHDSELDERNGSDASQLQDLSVLTSKIS